MDCGGQNDGRQNDECNNQVWRPIHVGCRESFVESVFSRGDHSAPNYSANNFPANTCVIRDRCRMRPLP